MSKFQFLFVFASTALISGPLLGNVTIRCSTGNITLTNAEYAHYVAIKTCYGRASLPEGAGGGYFGNILRNPKCTDVHAHVLPQVERCMYRYYKGQDPTSRLNPPVPLAQQTITTCTITEEGLISDHIYMGICLVNPGPPRSLTLITWTDPWASMDNFYCHGTGQNASSHTLY